LRAGLFLISRHFPSDTNNQREISRIRIPLPNGDELIPDIEFAEKLSVTRRTLGNLDREGLPFILIGGCKYRPLTEGLNWIASRIQRRNLRRRGSRKAEAQAET
jgi:hypothetical protein